jgi:uncharacterized protein (DUF362 family)
LRPVEWKPGLVGAAVDERRDRQSCETAYADQSHVDELVRRAFIAAGLGRSDPAAPLKDLIPAGATVLLKPNWVLDVNQSNLGMECMITHSSVVEAAVREVGLARPARIIVGDAPIQLCKIERIATAELRARLSAAAGRPVEIVDFRRTVCESQDMSAGVTSGRRDESRYVRFDLGSESLLEPVSDSRQRFRVTNYDPRELARTHAPGRHQYLLCREAFEADVILNLPKLKMHRKAGLTAALKNLVGLNGSKEFLPHHRKGSAEEGGDCYARRSLTLTAVEEALDRANHHIGSDAYKPWYDLAIKCWRRQNRRAPAQVEGSWHGNDTVWRMVLDLNRMLLYGCADGTMADVPLRRIYTLTDAVVAGEKEGPMAPSPALVGLLTFGANSCASDLVNAALVGMDWRKVALLRESFGAFRYPLATVQPEHCRVAIDGVALDPFEAFARYGRRLTPPDTWRGHVELDEGAGQAA